jgi:hypothetical protein
MGMSFKTARVKSLVLYRLKKLLLGSTPRLSPSYKSCATFPACIRFIRLYR